MPATTPVTIFTGFLGAGKTTTILALIRRLPPSYKVVILKNEFGEVSVDSQIAAQSNVEVTEIMNGCLCCVLVGQMKTALLEIKEKFNPDRIIIETSGSAFPAPLAWQVRQIADQGFSLDAIVTIVDCVNFRGYEDTSYTAKLQAKYTDLILLSKHELVSERDLDLVLDRINDLNEDTPKLKCEGLEGVSTDVVFGIDTKLFALTEEKNGLVMDEHHHKEIDIIQITSTKSIDKEVVEEVFSKIGDSVYRVKGFLGGVGGAWILNWAFGRCTWVESKEGREGVLLSVMGVQLGGLRKRIAEGLGVEEGCCELLH